MLGEDLIVDGIVTRSLTDKDVGGWLDDRQQRPPQNNRGFEALYRWMHRNHRPRLKRLQRDLKWLDENAQKFGVSVEQARLSL